MGTAVSSVAMVIVVSLAVAMIVAVVMTAEQTATTSVVMGNVVTSAAATMLAVSVGVTSVVMIDAVAISVVMGTAVSSVAMVIVVSLAVAMIDMAVMIRGGYQRRDDRRGGFDDRGERGGFRREDRGRGGYQRRDDRRGGFRDDRRDGRGPRGNDRRKDANYQNYSSTEEYVSPNGNEPTIPAGVSAQELDADAARALTTLSGPNRDIVARHLVMAGQLIDLDPEAAYQHAQAAVSRAGRVDVVREAAALTAYASGRYEEALREVRAVRRMRGDESLRAVEADAERGLGHPEKAVEIIDATDSSSLDLAEQVELVLVSSGARADLGQSDVGLVIVDDALGRAACLR